MRGLTAAAMAALMLPGSAIGSEIGDTLAQRLYDGTLSEVRAEAIALCPEHADACFAAGLTDLIGGVEALSQAFYRHGGTAPGTPAAAMLLGIDSGTTAMPLNPDPEPLSYEQLRTILGDFVTAMDAAKGYFEQGDGSEFVIAIEPLRVRIDLDGNGVAEAEETLAAVVGAVGEFANIPSPDAPPVSDKTRSKRAEAAAPDLSIGFDNADSIWFAGYTQVVAAPVDLLLAHDFSEFFDAYLHRVFPVAGLLMQNYSRGSRLMMDPESDAFIADIIAAIHTIDFPVTDAERLAGVLERLKAITALSRQNWELILAESDDDRELVPSPRQTSLLPETPVTEQTVAAWLATLDTMDQIFAGELLVPHWRFEQGFDLSAYFATASETDLVMLIAGQGALPYLRPGPIADARSFAEANEAFGTDWLRYAFWFN
ncbi:MAG TPA: hypothetical protein VGN60_09290 [Devosia sp.]|jgi:hypothetical protein|nr:hypothetical protein [Devosia sp.]